MKHWTEKSEPYLIDKQYILECYEVNNKIGIIETDFDIHNKITKTFYLIESDKGVLIKIFTRRSVMGFVMAKSKEEFDKWIDNETALEKAFNNGTELAISNL